MQAFSRKIQNYIFILRTVFKISKLDFVVLLCSQILTNLLPLLILYTSKLFIEIIVDSSQRELSELIKVLLIFLGLNILRDIGAIISERGRTFISIKIQDYFNIMIMEKTARLSLEVFDTAEYYQQYTDAQRILGGRWDSLVFAPFVLISLLLNALGVSAILIDYNPWLFLCVLVGVLPKVVADIKSRKERHRFHSDEVPEVRKYNYIKGIITN